MEYEIKLKIVKREEAMGSGWSVSIWGVDRMGLVEKFADIGKQIEQGMKELPEFKAATGSNH